MSITPEQFNKLATKDDLKDLVTKDDFDKKIDKILVKQIITESDLKELKQDMATKEDINKVLTAVDKIVKEHKDHKDEHVANLGAHERMQEDVNEVREHVGLKVKHPALTPKMA